MASPASTNSSTVSKFVVRKLEKPVTDNRLYRVIKLENKLEVILIHDAKAEKASAALNVSVGNLSDPDNLPGLAHFCEHLLFMGTRSYPDKNAYKRFLEEHSGTSNASTFPNYTTYFFDVAHDSLSGALDRFSKFFSEPLFLSTCVDREVEAVNSEFNGNLNNDYRRMYQLRRSLSNPEHPYKKFGTGNINTLKNIPLREGIDVRAEIMKFHKEHYSANLMRLAVLGRESLDDLQKMVSKLFSKIENNNKIPLIPTEALVTPNELNRTCFMKPLRDMHELHLYFPCPNQVKNYKTKADTLISSLLSEYGTGSLYIYLKKKCWVKSVNCSIEDITRDVDYLDLCLILTPEGAVSYKKVVKAVFQYIGMLKNRPSLEDYWNEQKRINSVLFKYRPNFEPIDLTKWLANIMQELYPRDKLFIAPYCYLSYDESIVKTYLDCLRVDNFWMFFISSTLPDEWPYTEKYYGTNYQLESMPNDFLIDLASPGDNDEFSLPETNPYIPENFDVGPLNDIPLRNPTLIKHTDLMNLWHKRDDQFQIPWTAVRFKLYSPLCLANLGNYIKVVSLSNLLNYSLIQELCQTANVGYSYSVGSSNLGITVGISGYSDKIHLILEIIMARFKNLRWNSAQFQNFKSGYLQILHNSKFNSPVSLVDSQFDYLTCLSEWTIEEKIRTVENLSESDMIQFIEDFPKKLYVEGLVCGSLTKTDALNLAQLVENLIQYEPASKIRTVYNIIPNETSFIQQIAYNPEEVNSAIRYSCHIGNSSDLRDRGRLTIIQKLIREPLFTKLRTEQQLGYQVNCSTWRRSTILGLSISIQGERPAPFLESRIEAFLMSYEKEIQNLREGDFETLKQAAIHDLLTPVTTIDGEFARFSLQIESSVYDFEQNNKTVEEIKNISKAEVLELYRTTILPTSSKRRVLSCQVISQCCKGEDSANVELRKILSSHSIFMEDQKYQGLADNLSQLEQNKRLQLLLEYIDFEGFDSSVLSECTNRLNNLLSSTTLSLKDVPKIKRIQILDAQAYKNLQAKAPPLESVAPIESFMDLANV